MKTTLAAVLAAFLFMGAMCSTPADVTAFVNAVQKNAVTACGFLPLAETISAILAGATGQQALQAGADALAKTICAAVGPPPVAGTVTAGPAPTVDGVPIYGHWVVK